MLRSFNWTSTHLYLSESATLRAHVFWLLTASVIDKSNAADLFPFDLVKCLIMCSLRCAPESSQRQFTELCKTEESSCSSITLRAVPVSSFCLSLFAAFHSNSNPISSNSVLFQNLFAAVLGCVRVVFMENAFLINCLWIFDDRRNGNANEYK